MTNARRLARALSRERAYLRRRIEPGRARFGPDEWLVSQMRKVPVAPPAPLVESTARRIAAARRLAAA